MPDAAGSQAAASISLAAMNGKMVEALHANAQAWAGHLQAVSRVTSMPELITLQSRFVRERFEALRAQAREISGLSATLFGQGTTSSGATPAVPRERRR